MRGALFATDLDGTLVDRDDRIHPRDREAIAQARARGVVVTIATGRLTSRTLPVARALGLDAPLVCADGGVIACGSTERVLSQRSLAADHVEEMVDVFVKRELSSFVFTHDSIHSCERGRPYHGYVSGWAGEITTHADIRAVWRGASSAAVMVLGIGPEEVAEGVEGDLASLAPHVDAMTYAFRGFRVVRYVLGGVSKGSGLEEVARQLGIDRERVAVIGDWYNDQSMFRWAGRSFAMPHAPHDVKDLATDVLPEESPSRGPIADALEAWMAETLG